MRRASVCAAVLFQSAVGFVHPRLGRAACRAAVTMAFDGPRQKDGTSCGVLWLETLRVLLFCRGEDGAFEASKPQELIAPRVEADEARTAAIAGRDANGQLRFEPELGSCSN